MYAALFALCALCALQGFSNAHAGITLSNVKSIALHRAMGFVDAGLGVFRHVGYEIGRWQDVGGHAGELAPQGEGEPAVLTAIGDVPADAVTHALAMRPRSPQP